MSDELCGRSAVLPIARGAVMAGFKMCLPRTSLSGGPPIA